MQLECPECGARYEVPDDAIPEAGRDVQCSGCGHRWFKGGAVAFPAKVASGAAVLTPATGASDPAEAESSEDRPLAPPPRQRLDDATLAILREEAERETAARRNDPPGAAAARPSSGLPSHPPGPRRAMEDAPGGKDPLAAVERDPPATEPSDDGRTGPARAGEIAAPTTRPGSEPARRGGDIDPSPADPSSNQPSMVAGVGTIDRPRPVADTSGATPPLETSKASGSGFRAGFGLVMLIFLVALAAYVTAPRIVAALPESEPAMSRYVRGVDATRDRLHRTVRSGVAWVQGIGGR